MSKWPGKYVIGLTGNIATGKSVVRRMLEHLGAYTIDADALAHRAIAKGAPGYQPVVDTFGKWVLDTEGNIDRTKLGRLAFADPEALKQLETIIHPLVQQAVDLLVARARQPIVVIEAIKLLETDLREACDVIWVTDAPPEVQIERLMRKRGMSREEARRRVEAQTSQKEKVAAADVIIYNNGSYDALWKQVTAAWKKISPTGDTGPVVVKEGGKGEFSVQRGRPRDAKVIAELITRLSNQSRPTSVDDVMEAFGEKAFLLLRLDEKVVGLAGWQVENLVARTTDLYVAPQVPVDQAVETLIREVERASSDLQCEVSLLFVAPELAARQVLWQRLGYEPRTPNTLGVQAWEDAAHESMVPGTQMLFKKLRQDRVLRPI
ncbi:MAG: dephospho-CoA kinase [Anaerolineae bacterium]|nr:MAG: dephospho-CoA kinase [Anaerolineae bacterium]